MPHQSPTANLIVAASYFQHLWHETGSEIFNACSKGLSALAEKHALYEKTSDTAKKYFHEIQETADTIVTAVDKKLQDPQAIAFQTIENLAVIFKEGVLKTKSLETAAEKTVFAFFEESGLWEKKSATLIADLYHRQLPREASKKISLDRLIFLLC